MSLETEKIVGKVLLGKKIKSSVLNMLNCSLLDIEEEMSGVEKVVHVGDRNLGTSTYGWYLMLGGGQDLRRNVM